MIDLEQIGYFLFMEQQEQEQKRQEDIEKEWAYSRFESPAPSACTPQDESKEA